MNIHTDPIIIAASEILSEAIAFSRTRQTMGGLKAPEGAQLKLKSNSTVYAYKRTKGGKTFVDFIEKDPSDGLHPQVYTYSVDNGNLTRGSGDLWARQEIWSNSAAFNKGKPEKMAVPDDIDAALKKVIDHLSKYVPRHQ